MSKIETAKLSFNFEKIVFRPGSTTLKLYGFVMYGKWTRARNMITNLDLVIEIHF